VKNTSFDKIELTAKRRGLMWNWSLDMLNNYILRVVELRGSLTAVHVAESCEAVSTG